MSGVLTASIIPGMLSGIIKTFPLVADEDTKYPFCVYRRAAYTPIQEAGRVTGGYEIDYEITLVAQTYTQSLELLDEVITLINDYRGVVDGVAIHDIDITGAEEYYNDTAYIQELIIRVLTN